MGTVTPNISIYIPSPGETNYDAPFLAGMINIDQHDHSGPPLNGVPIASSGLAVGAVQYTNLNANVADNTTGIGTAGALGPNQLSILGLLKSIFQIATATGLIAKNGSNATAVTLTGTANQITVTNGDGSSGNPTFSFPTTFFAEGTWTPAFTGSSGSGTLTYTTQYGIYQRIGNWVECFGYVKVNAISVAMSGNLQITGFPFAFNSNASNFVMGMLDPAVSTVTAPTTSGGTFPFIRGANGFSLATVYFYNPTTGSDDTYNSASWSPGDDLAFRIRYLIN